MLYFIEGVVRLNDKGLSAYLAGAEIVLTQDHYAKCQFEEFHLKISFKLPDHLQIDLL